MKNTKSFDPNTPIFNTLIKHAIAPRPICLASTIDADGNVNLSPFSYFNLMGQNPPICVFSPLRKMRDGSTKHTLDNIIAHPECVINRVDYAIVQQQSLSSVEYPKVVKEFVKKVSERAVGADVMKSLTPGQQVIKIVQDELVH